MIRRASRLRVLSLAVGLLACDAVAERAAAQCLPPAVPPEEAGPCTLRYPSWTGEVASLGANALLGGVTAGLQRMWNGGSFADGFVRGAAGGAVIYGGKRIAVERFGGAGLVGREVASVGASMVRNAGDNIGMFDRVILPVGPTRVYLGRGGTVSVKADLMALGWLVYAITEDELSWDPAMSLSAGVPVFLTDNRVIRADSDSSHAGGIAEPGVLMISDVPAFGRDFARRVFEHERVHVLQFDHIFLTITDPVEDAALDQVPYLRRLNRWFDINLSSELIRFLNGRIPEHLERPWETEAIFLSR